MGSLAGCGHPMGFGSAETVRVSSLDLGQVSGQKKGKTTAVWKGDSLCFVQVACETL